MLPLAALLFGAFIPSDVRIATSDRTLQFTSGGATLSAATLCPGFRFDQFGATGPTFSPDLHYVLVDVLGPFDPGNVGRNHALVQVASGSIVRASDWPHYFGIKATSKAVAWASGERQTLRYDDAKTQAIPQTPLHPLPANPCNA